MKRAKDPNTSTLWSVDGGVNGLWSEIRRGYAEISVIGDTFLEDDPYIRSTDNSSLRELNALIEAQTSSVEVEVIGEVLFQNYGILRVIPATSYPVGVLSVMVHIYASPNANQGQLEIELSFSHGLSSVKTAKAQGSLPVGSQKEERLTHLRHTASGVLKKAFEKLEASQKRPFSHP